MGIRRTSSMKSMTSLNSYLKQVAASMLFWSICLGFFAIFRYLGIDRIPNIEVNGSISSLVLSNVIAMSVLGCVLGLVYATIDYFLDEHISKNLSLGAGLISKTIIYFIVTIGLLRLAQIIAQRKGMELNFEDGWLWWSKDERFIAILLYIMLCSFVFFLLKIALERFGKGVFVKILLGRYRTHKEEKRIFMFLDLKDSTSIAERLGHLKYSQFIQDCFHDLNRIVFKYEAEIYQYVGDEAVLTWTYAKGVMNNNCVELFFGFEQERQSRRDYYIEKYGVYPEFKAGLHGGALMVAEVGFVKKELAYHGDVINTSARIQAQCNNYNAALLISERLIEDINTEGHATSNFLGSVFLKGKKKEVKIHAVIP